MVDSLYFKSIFSLILLVFAVNLGSAALTTTISINDTDIFYSSYAGNEIIHLVAIVANDTALVTKYANFTSFSSTCGTGGIVNFTQINATAYNASCNVSAVAALSNFVPGIISTVFAQGNGIGSNLSVKNAPTDFPIIYLYNFTKPVSLVPTQMNFGPLMTDLSNQTNLSGVNYIIDVAINGSAFGLPWSGLQTVALYNFSSLNMTSSDIGSQLASLAPPTGINVNLGTNSSLPSSIFLNSTLLSSFNTTTVLKLFNLPFRSLPNITSDGGTPSSMSYAYASGFGNLTFTANHFSTYNASDLIAPIITVNSPIANSISQILVLNATFNGTSSSINNASINITVSGAGLSIYYGYANLSCTTQNDDELISCNKTISLADGNYNVTFTVSDLGFGIGNSANITRNFTLDSTGPAVLLLSPTNGLNQTTNQTYLLANFSDSGIGLKNITLYVWYANGTLYNSTSVNKTGATNSSNISMIFSSEGTYSWNYLAFDNVSNSATNSTNWTITYDKTSPTITSIGAGSLSTSSAIISWTTNENTNSSVNYGTSTSLGTVASDSSLSTSHSITLSGLSASTTYYYNVTSCDSTGNCNTSGANSFTTSAETVTETSVSSGTATVINYPALTVDQVTSGYAINMLKKGRVAFKFGGETHHVAVIGLDAVARTATINVSSTPLIKTLSVGDSLKVNLDGDNYYDLLITLNNVSTTRANITIVRINELISSTPAASTETTTTVTDVNAPQIEKSSVWKYVLIWIVIILVLGVIFWFAFLKEKLRERKVYRSIHYSSKF